MPAEDNRVIDFAARRFTHRGQTVSLTALEARLLEYLWRNQPRFVTRPDALAAIERPASNANFVDKLVSRLRSTLGNDLIRTVPGVGYAWNSALVAQAPTSASAVAPKVSETELQELLERVRRIDRSTSFEDPAWDEFHAALLELLIAVRDNPVPRDVKFKAYAAAEYYERLTGPYGDGSAA